MKVMIIEDEPEIRRLLRLIIEKQDGFTVAAESGDFASAVLEFAKHRPDIVFVDIDLNGESGLECAKVLTELNPKVKIIFATAHSEYMANAFEVYAFDYLVKPFNVARVIKTLSRIRDEAKEELLIVPSEKYKGKLMIRGKEQVSFIDKKEIIFIERSENATKIFTEEEIYRTSAALSAIMEKLEETEFMRCHKSYIINLSKISRIEPYGRWTYIVKLKGTEETALMTSQNYEEIKKIFG